MIRVSGARIPSSAVEGMSLDALPLFGRAMVDPGLDTELSPCQRWGFLSSSLVLAVQRVVSSDEDVEVGGTFRAHI